MSNTYRPPFLQTRIKQLVGGSAYNHSDFERILNYSQVNYSLGAVMGGWIGDTLGSYCEFQPSIVSDQKLNQAMKMNGGGPFKILPGQFTDDSQMSVALLKGLNSAYKSQNKSMKDQKWRILKQISKEYVEWLESDPFDIGMTCYGSIDQIRRSLKKGQNWNKSEFDDMFLQLHRLNGSKQSNGSLMRISPMGVFYSLYEGQKEELDELVEGEIKLTHPNRRLVQASYDWIRLSNLLINRTPSHSLQNIYEAYLSYHGSKPNSLIKQYIEQGLKDELMNGVHKMGWAKIAYSYSLNQFRHIAQMQQKQPATLINSPSDVFKYSIRTVMRQGGDTDTNCAIVGSLIGSIVGFKGLPQQYIKKVIDLNLLPESMPGSPSWSRPSIYEPRNAFLRLLKLVGKLNPKFMIV